MPFDDALKKLQSLKDSDLFENLDVHAIKQGIAEYKANPNLKSLKVDELIGKMGKFKEGTPEWKAVGKEILDHLKNVFNKPPAK